MQTGVYLVTCARDGKQYRYIGSSRNIVKRWIEHRYDLKHNQHPNRRWQHLWNKLGPEGFTWAIVEETANDDTIIRERERYWLDLIRPELNYSFEAHRTRLGVKSSDETKQRMAEGMRQAWAKKSEDERVQWLKGITEGSRARSAERQKPRKPKRVTVRKADLTPDQWAAHRREISRRSSRKRYREKRIESGLPTREERRAERQREAEEWEAGSEARELVRRQKLSRAFKGRPLSEELKDKIRRSVLQRWQDPGYRALHQQRTREAMQNPEIKERLRETHLGKAMPEEQKQKIREANLGRKRSPQTRQRLSEARKRVWALKRAQAQS